MPLSKTHSSSTKQAHKWKWLGRALAISGFGAPIIILPLSFGKISIYWGMGILIFAIFLGIQGMALSSFAEIKEAEGQDPILEEGKKKRAVLWHMYPNLTLFLLGLAFLFQDQIFTASKVELSLLPQSVSAGILVGGLFGLAKIWVFLVPQINGGILREGDKRTKNLSWLFGILQFIIVLITMHNREMICQNFSNTNFSNCPAPMIIFSSFFLGVLLIESIWIFLWEHRNHQKLYM